MNIGFDGKRAVKNNTGLGNYSRLLIDVLATNYPDNNYIVYSPEMRQNPRLQPLLGHNNVELRLPDTSFGRHAKALWRSWGMTRQLQRDGINLMHGLSGELPLNIGGSNIATVVTIHDLIFRRHPECYKAIDRSIYDYKFRKACNDATRILAISECTKRDIIADYGIDAGRIDVVYQGCHQQFHRTPTPAEIADVRKKYNLPTPYIISVATVEQRKNQLMPISGLRGLPDDFHLVLIGRRTDYARSVLDSFIATHRLANRITFVERANFADLPALYAGAFCSSYTSRYEGFGIPVIESLNVGTPVVVATGSCLEEAGGPSTPAVNPDDVEQWISVVTDMIDHPDLRMKIVRAGQAYVSRFNDADMARGTMECYRKALQQQ